MSLEGRFAPGKGKLGLGKSWKCVTCSNVFLADTGLTCQQQHYKATLFYKILKLQEYLFPGCGRLMLFVLVMPIFADGLFKNTCWIDFSFCLNWFNNSFGFFSETLLKANWHPGKTSSSQ